MNIKLLIRGLDLRKLSNYEFDELVIFNAHNFNVTLLTLLIIEISFELSNLVFYIHINMQLKENQS